MDGIINLNKPAGITSHTAVSKIRRILGQKRVGHTGTLDPLATGVLPICAGKATKAADLIMAQDKTYVAGIKLGITSDTHDTQGTITTVCTPDISLDQIKQAADTFVGQIMQTPPMYSAIKIDGKKLYELARKGVEIERPARQITIHRITVLPGDDTSDAKLSVHCSKGTYIRSLCHDIGQLLGFGAVMSSLERTQNGIFSIKDSVTLEQLQHATDAGTLAQLIVPTEHFFSHYPRYDLLPKQEQKVRNGVPIAANDFTQDQIVRLHGTDGTFLCLSMQKGDKLVLYKSFY